MKNKILLAFLVLSITGCMHAQTSNTNSIGTLSATELNSRAETYSGNRQFPEARQYWQALIDNYPDDKLEIGRAHV